MEIKKGTLLKVFHTRHGIFKGKATRDFDTDKETFYPISLEDDYVDGLRTIFYKGDTMPCRNTLCKIEIIGGYDGK